MKNDKFRTEFHVHTRISKDSILCFWLLLLMLKLKKINSVAITDHNETYGAIKCMKFFKKFNIEVIVGEEIYTTNGEIIGLNLSKKIDANLSPKQTIYEIKKQGGIVYVPHPYDEKRYKTVLEEKYICEYKNEIDYIEVHNGRNVSTSYDDKQNLIADKYGIKKICGSDAHTFFEIGRNYIITDKLITSNNICNLKNDFIFKEKQCIKFSHKCTKVIKFIKLIGKGEFYEIFRIINKRIKRKK